MKQKPLSPPLHPPLSLLQLFHVSMLQGENLGKESLPGKFMLTQHKHVAPDFCYDLALVLGPAVLQDVLDNIIAILILGETAEMATKLGKGLEAFPAN